MHSVAIIESGAKIYLVTMMSNVLRLNSAVEHQKVATEVEKLLQSRPARDFVAVTLDYPQAQRSHEEPLGAAGVSLRGVPW